MSRFINMLLSGRLRQKYVGDGWSDWRPPSIGQCPIGERQMAPPPPSLALKPVLIVRFATKAMIPSSLRYACSFSSSDNFWYDITTGSGNVCPESILHSISYFFSWCSFSLSIEGRQQMAPPSSLTLKPVLIARFATNARFLPHPGPLLHSRLQTISGVIPQQAAATSISVLTDDSVPPSSPLKPVSIVQFATKARIPSSLQSACSFSSSDNFWYTTTTDSGDVHPESFILLFCIASVAVSSYAVFT